MKKCGIFNPDIAALVAALGHTEYLCIADCGLPVPKGVEVIDISLKAGVPGFMQVLETVCSELVVESYIVAQELEAQNPKLLQAIRSTMKSIPLKTMSHTEFKKSVQKAKCVIRTGEVLPFANILLVGGVNF